LSKNGSDLALPPKDATRLYKKIRVLKNNKKIKLKSNGLLYHNTSMRNLRNKEIKQPHVDTVKQISPSKLFIYVISDLNRIEKFNKSMSSANSKHFAQDDLPHKLPPLDSDRNKGTHIFITC
jgi:hypothetical protein